MRKLRLWVLLQSGLAMPSILYSGMFSARVCIRMHPKNGLWLHSCSWWKDDAFTYFYRHPQNIFDAKPRHQGGGFVFLGGGFIIRDLFLEFFLSSRMQGDVSNTLWELHQYMCQQSEALYGTAFDDFRKLGLGRVPFQDWSEFLWGICFEFEEQKKEGNTCYRFHFL